MHTWDPNSPVQSGPRSNGNEDILPRAPKLGPYHKMQFSVILDIPLRGGGKLTPLQEMQSSNSQGFFKNTFAYANFF